MFLEWNETIQAKEVAPQSISMHESAVETAKEIGESLPSGQEYPQDSGAVHEQKNLIRREI
jgi:hypothetical protein